MVGVWVPTKSGKKLKLKWAKEGSEREKKLRRRAEKRVSLSHGSK